MEKAHSNNLWRLNFNPGSTLRGNVNDSNGDSGDTDAESASGADGKGSEEMSDRNGESVVSLNWGE